MAAHAYLRKNAPKGDQTRKARYTIRLSESMMRAARRLATKDRVSLNQWIGAAVTEKINAAVAFAGRSRGRVQVAGDLLAPINADWNVDEDL